MRDAYDVIPVKRSDCENFILNIHYAKRWPSVTYAYGLIRLDTLELVGYGNEMMMGSGGTTLHINYRCAGSGASTTPANWYWRCGTSSSFSNHYFALVCSCSLIKGK